jgi:cation transport ATPase
MSQHIFHVSGMHCKACILLVEDELKDLPEISYAKASFKHHHVELRGEFGGRSVEEIIAFLTPPLQKHGYSLSLERINHTAKWGEFGWAVPLALLFLGGFVALQKLGIVNLLTVNEISYPAAFLIGLVASVSSCMAVVGGLTLSVSANFAKEGERFRPQVACTRVRHQAYSSRLPDWW